MEIDPVTRHTLRCNTAVLCLGYIDIMKIISATVLTRPNSRVSVWPRSLRLLSFLLDTKAESDEWLQV